MEKLSLLLVDDEVEISEIIGEIINDAFPEIELGIANTARQASEMMPNYDMVLSDINMPEKDILDKAILIHSKSKPIARITGHYEESNENVIIVKKPFTFKDIIAVVTTLKGQINEKKGEQAPLLFEENFVADFGVLDTSPEKEFDNITFLAAALCDTPIATIGFNDKNRQWVKSKLNIEVKEVSSEQTFCIQNPEPKSTMIVEDTLLDDRFKLNVIVTSGPKIRFYVGVPLVSKEGFVIGTLCVCDTKTRKLTSLQIKGLEALADQTMLILNNRRQQLEETKESDWKKALLSNSAYPIIATNKMGKIVTFNKAAETLLGYSSNEILGKSPDIFLIASEVETAAREIREKYKVSIRPEQVFTYQANRGETFEREWTHVRKNGSKVPVLVTISAVKNAKGEITGYIGLTKDLSDQKQKDQVITTQQNVLIESSRMSSLGEMASGIAHEINNPLAILSGRCSLLIAQAEVGQLESKGTIAALNKMLDTIERASKIIRGLKNLSRTSVDNEPFVSQSVSDVVEESLAICEEKFRRNGIELKRNIDKNLRFLGQGVKMSQVLVNLLNNSFDALQNQKNKKINISAIQKGDRIEIRFTDSGPEIPEIVKERMMTPFFTTKEVGKGTGIGLSISKNICEQHKGSLRLDLESKETTFIIDLPILLNPGQSSSSVPV